jgi:hypothetical protein
VTARPTSTTSSRTTSGPSASARQRLRLLNQHFNADGKYLLTGVRHAGRLPAVYRWGDLGESYSHENQFTCIPFELPFRPRRLTSKLFVQGTQTAVAVGPPGEEIFTDKYGRVKVQFHWDRLGRNNADSSCWIRVGALWAGNQWGTIHIPRIGQEVIVDFKAAGTSSLAGAAAAFQSGGSVGPPDGPEILPREFATARAVAHAVWLATFQDPPEEEPERLLSFVTRGVDVATGANLWTDPVETVPQAVEATDRTEPQAAVNGASDRPDPVTPSKRAVRWQWD